MPKALDAGRLGRMVGGDARSRAGVTRMLGAQFPGHAVAGTTARIDPLGPFCFGLWVDVELVCWVAGQPGWCLHQRENRESADHDGHAEEENGGAAALAVLPGR